MAAADQLARAAQFTELNRGDMAADVARTGTWRSVGRTFLGFEQADALFTRR